MDFKYNMFLYYWFNLIIILKKKKLSTSASTCYFNPSKPHPSGPSTCSDVPHSACSWPCFSPAPGSPAQTSAVLKNNKELHLLKSWSTVFLFIFPNSSCLRSGIRCSQFFEPYAQCQLCKCHDIPYTWQKPLARGPSNKPRGFCGCTRAPNTVQLLCRPRYAREESPAKQGSQFHLWTNQKKHIKSEWSDVFIVIFNHHVVLLSRTNGLMMFLSTMTMSLTLTI